jgi:hypothetical protein
MSAVLEFLGPTIVRSVEAACEKIDTGNFPCLLQETQIYLKTPGHPRWGKSVGLTGKLAGMRKTFLVKEYHNGVSDHLMHGCQCEQLRLSTTKLNFPNFHGIHTTISPYSYIFHSSAVRTDISFFSLHKCACMGENRGHSCTQSTLTAPLMSQDVSGAKESQNGCYDCATASYSCWLDNILKVFLRSNCAIKQPCSVTICALAGTSMESCRGARPTSLRQVRAHSPARRF